MALGNLSVRTGFSGPAFSPDLYKTLTFYQRGQKLSAEGRKTDQEDPAGSAGTKQRGGQAPPLPRDKLQKKTGQKSPWAQSRTKKDSRD